MNGRTSLGRAPLRSPGVAAAERLGVLIDQRVDAALERRRAELALVVRNGSRVQVVDHDREVVGRGDQRAEHVADELGELDGVLGQLCPELGVLPVGDEELVGAAEDAANDAADPGPGGFVGNVHGWELSRAKVPVSSDPGPIEDQLRRLLGDELVDELRSRLSPGILHLTFDFIHALRHAPATRISIEERRWVQHLQLLVTPTPDERSTTTAPPTGCDVCGRSAAPVPS